MAHDIEPTHTVVARPVQPVGPEWPMEPQILTPLQNHVGDREWAVQTRPPYIAGTFQEKWSKAVTPLRATLLGGMWVTWHWTRTAAALLIVALLSILFIVR